MSLRSHLVIKTRRLCDKTLSKCWFWVVQRTIRICETYVITDLKSAKYQFFFDVLQFLWIVYCAIVHISYFVYSIVQLCIFHILWKALCNCAYSIFCVQHCAIVHIPGAESQRRNYTSKEPFVRSTQQYDATDTEGQSIAIYVILIIEWVLCKIEYLVERTNHNMTNSELVNEWYFKGDMTFPGER